MKARAILIGLALLAATTLHPGCATQARAPRKPAVAIVINAGVNSRPSSEEVALVHRTLRPELEKRGYVLARSSRSTDYFVHVRLPFDPMNVGPLEFERAEPTVPFIRQHETDQERRQRENARVIAEMTREPR